MKQLIRNSIHTNTYSHDCMYLDVNGKKVKMTYSARNSVETCNTEIFDGYKWNHLFSMLDLGVIPETSAYNIWDEKKRKHRSDELFKLSEKMCKIIIN